MEDFASMIRRFNDDAEELDQALRAHEEELRAAFAAYRAGDIITIPTWGETDVSVPGITQVWSSTVYEGQRAVVEHVSAYVEDLVVKLTYRVQILKKNGELSTRSAELRQRIFTEKKHDALTS